MTEECKRSFHCIAERCLLNTPSSPIKNQCAATSDVSTELTGFKDAHPSIFMVRDIVAYRDRDLTCCSFVHSPGLYAKSKDVNLTETSGDCM